MSKGIPRKLKKACKSYRNDIPLKTKYLRYVHTRCFTDWYYEEHAYMFETKRY